jgi:coproporphyrinogen III oxidase
VEPRDYFPELHHTILTTCERLDGGTFRRDVWRKGPDEPLAGDGVTGCLEGGRIFERAGVSLSRVQGRALPPSATARRPELAGKPFSAVGVSVVLHPQNPYVPTSHMNVRLLQTTDGACSWFGGGFDLTPFYPFDDDVVHWHRVARDVCAPFGTGVYPTLKQRCDEYFFLKHRGETRGVGGLFVDDLAPGALPGIDTVAQCFALTRAIGDAFLAAYVPIVERRRDTPWGERERAFQLLRRGRYVEFNLVFDRGTHFGLQSGGRTESILTSMPPLASWRYDHQPEPGSAEARLSSYLQPRDWLAGEIHGPSALSATGGPR